MKILFVRPGAKDNSGNPVGFKAEEGSEDAHRLVAEGYRLSSDDAADADQAEETETVYTDESLAALELTALRAIGKQIGVRGYNLMREEGLRAGILAKQAETPPSA